MNPVSNNSSWLSLLLRWLSGEANRRDEAALDALAREDEFLREAMEGYRSLPAENHAAAVTRMKARLRQRQERRRGAGFYVLRAAAVGAVLLVGWLALRQFAGQEASAGIAEAKESAAPAAEEATRMIGDTVEALSKQDAVARNEQKTSEYAFRDEKAATPSPENSAEPAFLEPEKEEVTGFEAVAPAPTRLEEDVATAPVITQTDRVEPQAPSTSKPAPSGAGAAKESTRKRQEELKDKLAETEGAGKKTNAEEKTSAAKEKAMAKKKELDKKATPPRSLSGRVMDANGQPLIGASVLEKGSNNGAVTDVNGNFSLQLKTESPTLSISFPGFNVEEVQPGPSNYLDVTLAENAGVLSEVVVVGLGTQDDDSVTLTPLPKPEGGVKKLRKYIAENLRYPEAATEARVQGRVKVRFTVLADGTMTNMKVLKSLGHGCDEEAVRLLKEGPRWSPAGTATCTIRFKL